jgi:hypothetical protein
MKGLKIFGIVILTLFIISGLVVGGVLSGWFNTWFNNKVEYVDRKIQDRTSYDTRKKVEDTCRSMIASYKTDKATYEMYKSSDNEEKQSWAEQARMRANKTANTYNEYILKNSYVWEENIPSDIYEKLQIIN